MCISSPVVFLSASLFFVASIPLRAAPPTNLEVNNAGHILIRTDEWGDIQIRPEIVDTSEKRWVNLKSTKSYEAAEGKEVMRQGVHVFPDGSEVTHTTTAAIKGDKVEVKAEWPTDSMAPGFSRLDLWFSEEMARDLTVEVGGTAVTIDMTMRSKPFKSLEEVIFRQTSTGKFICRLKMERLAGSTFFLNDQPEQGMWFRSIPVPDTNASTIADVTAMEWSLSFKE